jgi:hypothetical protein
MDIKYNELLLEDSDEDTLPIINITEPNKENQVINKENQVINKENQAINTENQAINTENQVINKEDNVIIIVNEFSEDELYDDDFEYIDNDSSESE